MYSFVSSSQINLTSIYKFSANDNTIQVGEVRYFALLNIHGNLHAVAVLARYGSPNENLMKHSYRTYDSRPHLQDHGITVIDIKKIQSVVMMAPDKIYQHHFRDGTEGDRWFLVEKPGLKVMTLMGNEEDSNQEEYLQK